VNEALRAGLRGAGPVESPEPFRVEAKALGLRAGVDPQALGKLGDELEAEAFLELTRKMETGAP